MNRYHNIVDKLNRFTKKYYTKMLVKGILLFSAFGILFFFMVLGVEYFLWLGSIWRLVLLLVFLFVEVFLLYTYIVTPLFYLFKVKKGISNKQASLLIGKHFPQVDDKLFNLLDLAEDKTQSELLLASIEQRASSLDSIPFVKAVDFGDNRKYAKYLIGPILLFALIWFSGNFSSFFGSYERVVNYDLAYEPPAPFSFRLLSNDNEVLESEEYLIIVTTVGDVRPEEVFITIHGKELLMQKSKDGHQYRLAPPLLTTDFYFSANGVQSRKYSLKSLKTPSIQNFEIVLDYPSYTNKPTETLKGTGNAIFPEGTSVRWNIKGQNAGVINLITKDTTVSFKKTENLFEMRKRVYFDMAYQLSTSNENIENYERLDYKFEVVKDEYPKIEVIQVIDSLNPNVSYYTGEASDDYRLNTIKLACYADGDLKSKQVITLIKPNTNFNQFYYTFPSGLQLEEGRTYSIYFEAIDNDAIHNGKVSKSNVFSLTVLDENQLIDQQLESQQSILDNIDKSLQQLREQKEALQDISKEQKEKSNLNFSDQNQVKDFLRKQQHQESMMQKFSKQLRENLDRGDQDDEMNQMLKERLERQELEAKKNEKLLEELNKVADKINKEELAKRLEELGKKQQNNERNLEQLLELTKRYYVTEKASQLAKDLENLAEEQEKESEKEGDEKTKDEQKRLNEDFEKISDELRELEKDNEDLKKPVDLNIDKNKEEDIKQDQQEALEQINENEGSDESSKPEEKEKAAKAASQKQKSAAQKMKEMAAQLQQSSAAAGGESGITEDAEMLRQILDNLVTFSFKQENLFEVLKKADEDISHFSESVRQQQELKGLFEHVDDSLFALSLRRVELSEFVNERITEVYYNIDKSLESMAESRIYQGVSYQKYVISASNELADFLARILDNMQQSMQMGQGQGQGEGLQLPDIIKGQGELQEKMGQMGQSGKGKEGEGQEGEGGEKPGEGSKPGEGKNGQNGGEGEEGTGGKGGSSGNNGNQGGNDGGQGNGGGDQLNEQELQELYEIYKEQQMIRQQLENQLIDMINNGDRQLAEKLIQQMEDFENDLIENGVTPRTMNKMNNIQHQLLKLENAALKQGKKQERESETNRDVFKNVITTKPRALEDYRNEIEILNRQDLPLLQIYRNKVKEYFLKYD